MDARDRIEALGRIAAAAGGDAAPAVPAADERVGRRIDEG